MKPISRDVAARGAARDLLARRFDATRHLTDDLAAPLSAEDQTVQSMPDVSPTKWHRAHTSWFFETFLLQRFVPSYRVFHPAYAYLFNSYYEAVGPRHPRAERGLLSRPGIEEIAAYRAYVDEAMRQLIAALEPQLWEEAMPLVELGIQHEQQHQELLLMDVKHVLSLNPLRPAYRQMPAPRSRHAPVLDWVSVEGGLRQIGHSGEGFSFDNEGPRHKVWLEPFRLAARLVTCGEYLSFVEDGGYQRPEFWLSDGWAWLQRDSIDRPLYWSRSSTGWSIFTLGGERPLDHGEPVCHVSYYEADAFARWSGKRLPREEEWEIAARESGPSQTANLLDSGLLHPAPAEDGGGLKQMSGDVWEWTASPYVAYPGYRAVTGAIGEYNGKFMSNQTVLRGGASITPQDHVRETYRNFFPPTARWAFSGIRLAEDL